MAVPPVAGSGAEAIHPYLAFETLAEMQSDLPDEVTPSDLNQAPQLPGLTQRREAVRQSCPQRPLDELVDSRRAR